MALPALSTEIILSDLSSSVGHLHLDWTPQPGAYLEIEGQTYLVLERRHRYHLRSGRYHLASMALYVQKSSVPTEGSLWAGRWVIGDVTCLYNAHSEVLRCSVRPEGPCHGCRDYASI